MYAPTPYGEVCADDDASGEEARFAAREAFASETARGERGLNPDWDVAIELGGARAGAREGVGTKFELCVYGARARAREDANGGETASARRGGASGARWRRGEGLRATREGDGGGETTSDVLICRAAIDLTRLVRVGNRVPSGTAMPPNAVFLRLSDGGVYSPEPSAADASGRAVRAFIDAVRAKDGQNRRSASARCVERGGGDRSDRHGGRGGRAPRRSAVAREVRRRRRRRRARRTRRAW